MKTERLTTNYYQCSKCKKPCNTMTKEVQRVSGRTVQEPTWLSQCCQALMVVKSVGDYRGEIPNQPQS